jgi:uncharacterized protein (TIGR02246 family)
MTAKQSEAEAEIRELVDRWAQGIRAKDVDVVVANYAADIVTFDIVPPLRSSGTDAQRNALAAWFATWRGPIGYDIRELTITAGDDVAFSASLNRISGTKTDGEKVDVWVRVTAGYRKVGGRWMVTHEHVSVPFDMENGQALVDLKP